MQPWRVIDNPFFQPPSRAPRLEPPSPDILAFHRALPGYQPTPLHALPALAAELGIKQLLVKDESKRFGLNAFKVLGASYAIFRHLQQHCLKKGLPALEPASFFDPGFRERLGRLTFATATDGNHGRAVAWTARMLEQNAVILVPANTVKARIDAIRREGAEVMVVDGNYDETVLRAAELARAHGWQVISDTAYPGYTEIPGWIMNGYTTLFVEAEAQRLEAGLPAPDFVLLQAGVGGLAAGGVQFFRSHDRPEVPWLFSIEPTDADCLLESAAHPDGEPHMARGKQDSIMAGLNCGTPSLLAWPLLRDSISVFLAVEDRFAEEAMRTLYQPRGGDPRIISGESGAAGLAGLLALCREEGLEPVRKRYGLNGSSTVLLINTEGDTDPESFRRIVGGSAALPK